MTIWPASLPQSPLTDSFRETPPNAVIRTEMDQGPAKLRLRSTAGIRRLTMSFLMDADGVSTLDAFFLNDLLYGALRFDFPHPREGTVVSCRFVKPPEYAAVNGLYFRCGIELEIMP